MSRGQVARSLADSQGNSFVSLPTPPWETPADLQLEDSLSDQIVAYLEKCEGERLVITIARQFQKTEMAMRLRLLGMAKAGLIKRKEGGNNKAAMYSSIEVAQ